MGWREGGEGGGAGGRGGGWGGGGRTPTNLSKQGKTVSEKMDGLRGDGRISGVTG